MIGVIATVACAVTWLTGSLISYGDNATKTWLARAETYAAPITDQYEQTDAWCFIGEVYATQRDYPNAYRVANRIHDASQRDIYREKIASYIAMLGDSGEALRVVRMIESIESRDGARSGIARVLAAHKQYDSAVKVVEQVEQAHTQHSMYRVLARKAADGGQFAAARSIAKLFNPYDDLAEARIKELDEYIAQTEREFAKGIRFSEANAWGCSTSIRVRIRDLNGYWGSPSPADLAFCRESIASRESDDRAMVRSWFLIAVHRLERGETAGYREAITKAIERNGPRVADFHRVLFGVLISDLLMDAGDTDRARQYVKTVLTPDAVRLTFADRDKGAVQAKVVASW